MRQPNVQYGDHYMEVDYNTLLENNSTVQICISHFLLNLVILNRMLLIIEIYVYEQ